MAAAELCRLMERILLEDTAIKQVKIIDLAAAGSAKHDYVVAVVFTNDPPPAEPDAALKTTRKLLVRKMQPFGGKEVVPRKWSRQASLALNPDGTVDETKLRQNLLDETGVPREPVITLESRIMDTVATVLGIPTDRLCRDQSFFQNGGDSFAAIEVTSRLMRQGISLRVPDIAWSETLNDLPARVISHHPGHVRPTGSNSTDISTQHMFAVTPIHA